MKKMLICILSLILLFVLLFVLSGCSSKTEKNEGKNTNTVKTTNTTNTTSKSNTTKKENTTNTDITDFESAAEKQMAMPNEGDTIAIIHVRNFGNITVKFFGDIAPKAVENFVKHAEEGYYDGVKFHRVIDEFMIQGGDPEGTGRGGESIWGKGFEEELSYDLVPYRGSLCMASAGTGTSSLGSQFFITQANYNATMESRLKSAGYPTKLLEMYKKYGGYLSLYQSYTVFGQVIEGMDVVDAIAKVETTGSENSTPVEDVIIDTIEVTTYKAE